MGFYTVWIRSLGYHGREPLTYSCTQPLRSGTIVQVPLQKEQAVGFVDQEVPKPSFAAKPITKVYDLAPLPPELLMLTVWLRDFYATNIGIVTSLVLPATLSDKENVSAKSFVVEKPDVVRLTPMNNEQINVVKKVTKSNTYLLHGRTGSGKTRVYIELALRAVANGKSVLVLTPEIGLTSQLSQSFREVFGEQVIVLHSQLTPAQRQRAWRKILSSSLAEPAVANSGESSRVQPDQRKLARAKRSEEFAIAGATTPVIVIGPRSALFSPLANIGLIVIDEAHEPAYKQEQAPYYQARTVASRLAQLHHAPLIIGSATPSVGDYFLAEQREKPILRMTSLAKSDTSHKPTAIQIVDLKDRGQFSRSQQLSQPLLEAIESTLNRGEQSLVYLNRRGTARIVMCENCGWQALCPHCDLPLIYHADSGMFRCHTCGYHEPMRTSCPNCGHPSILFKTFGTKAVTEEIRRLFPHARVQRFDTDNLKSERLEAHYDTVKAGNIDILVGTQLIAKGLDLPKLSTLGIIQADSSLSVPDFTAAERTFQLISQALGRVGRGHSEAHAIIQTYHPESPILQAAISDDYQAFYQAELAERRTFHFPPFYYLLKLSCRRASYKSAEDAANKFKQIISSKIIGVEIDGPTPSFHEKLQGKYQCQLVIRSQQRSKLVYVIGLIPSGWTYDIDPIDLL